MEPTGPQSTEPIAAESAPPSSPEPEAPSGWLQTAIRAVTGRGERAAPPETRGAGEGGGEEEPWSAPAWDTKADYEVWLGKQQQSYADRRDRDRERRQVADRERERDDRIAGLEQEKAQARADGDTWTVGEKQDEIDALRAGVEQESIQSGALAEFVGALRAEQDAALLDPLIQALTPQVAKRLIEDASARDADGALLMAQDGLPVGVTTTEARSALAQAAIKAIKDAAKAEGRAEARKDPVLRKELMATFKATPEAEEEEPVVVSEAPSGSGPRDMNTFIRSVRASRAHT